MTTFRHACDAFDAMPWPLVVGMLMAAAAAYAVLDVVWGER